MSLQNFGRSKRDNLTHTKKGPSIRQASLRAPMGKNSRTYHAANQPNTLIDLTFDKPN